MVAKFYKRLNVNYKDGHINTYENVTVCFAHGFLIFEEYVNGVDVANIVNSSEIVSMKAVSEEMG